LKPGLCHLCTVGIYELQNRIGINTIEIFSDFEPIKDDVGLPPPVVLDLRELGLPVVPVLESSV
jgi:hypothetical protein